MKKKKYRLSVAGNVYVKKLYNILIVSCFVETPHCDVSTFHYAKLSRMALPTNPRRQAESS